MYIFQKNNNMNTTVTRVMVKKQNITVPQGPLIHPSIIKSFPSHNLTFTLITTTNELLLFI